MDDLKKNKEHQDYLISRFKEYIYLNKLGNICFDVLKKHNVINAPIVLYASKNENGEFDLSILGFRGDFTLIFSDSVNSIRIEIQDIVKPIIRFSDSVDLDIFENFISHIIKNPKGYKYKYL